MSISDKEFYLGGFMTVVIGLVIVVTGVVTAVVSMHKADIHHEETMVIQQNKSERGHWIWGTKVGDAKEIVQAIEDGKSNRGHWLWGHWDDVAESDKPEQVSVEEPNE